MATWKILDKNWAGGGDKLPLQCECGRDAWVDTSGDPGAPIIAIVGTNVIFEPPHHQPPDNWLPSEIQCRKCGRIYGD